MLILSFLLNAALKIVCFPTLDFCCQAIILLLFSKAFQWQSSKDLWVNLGYVQSKCKCIRIHFVTLQGNLQFDLFMYLSETDRNPWFVMDHWITCNYLDPL